MKRRRTELGLSQRAAARLADDISPTTWGSLEKHHQPVSDLTAAAICKALGWTVDSIGRILGGTDPLQADYKVTSAAAAREAIQLSAHGVDLDELHERDPEAYEAIMRQADVALRRARERRPT